MADAFCDVGDLEIAVGGAQMLRQLADPNKTGQPNQQLITDWLESGAGDLRSAAEVKHDAETLANLDARSLRKVRKVNAKLSAIYAYEEGAKGLAMPDWVRRGGDDAEAYLDQLKDGNRRLGRVVGGAAAPINQPAIGALDYDAADNLSVANGGNANPQGRSRPSTSGISIAAFRRNGFR